MDDERTQHQKDIIGDNVHWLRIERKAKARQIARFLGFGGSWIIREIENGTWNVSEEELGKLAQFFCVSVESLLVESEGMQFRCEQMRQIHERREQMRSLGEALDWEINDLLTVNEVSLILRVDDTTIRRWIGEGAMEAVILPGIARHQYRIRRSTVNAILAGSQRKH